MKISVIIMFLLAFAGPSFSAVKKKAKTKPVAKQHASARPKAKRVRTRTSPRTRTKTAKTSAKSARRATASAPVAARSLQQGQPSPERYAEIQQALVAKGYLKNEATGLWTNESGAALKHFQSDQNLTPDGKLNSLSLIALGLGPKRTMTAQSQPEVRP